MIQDIGPKRLDNTYYPEKTAKGDSIIIYFKNRQILLASDGESFRLPKFRDVFEESEISALRYLFAIDDEEYYLTDEVPAGVISTGNTGLIMAGVREMRRMKGATNEVALAVFTAIQLANWYKDNHYCGTCGSETVHSDKERALCCPECGRHIYPRILPAVIVGVLHDGKMVLTKYAGNDFPFYALIAGFTEIGETLEQTVAREVMEEVGLKVKNITYYKSQPWGIVDDLLVGFFCDLDGEDPTITLDTSELGVGEWLTPDEVVLQPDTLSLTNEMMTMFKTGKVKSARDAWRLL